MMSLITVKFFHEQAMRVNQHGRVFRARNEWIIGNARLWEI